MPISNPGTNNSNPVVNVTAFERSTGANVQHLEILATSVRTVFTENGARNGATIFNKGAYDVFLDVVDTVSYTSYMVCLAPQDFYEMLFNYTGFLYAIANEEATDIEVREFIH